MNPEILAAAMRSYEGREKTPLTPEQERALELFGKVEPRAKRRARAIREAG